MSWRAAKTAEGGDGAGVENGRMDGDRKRGYPPIILPPYNCPYEILPFKAKEREREATCRLLH